MRTGRGSILLFEHGRRRTDIRRSLGFAGAVLLVLILLASGCSAINPGKWKGIVKTAPDEKYYLVDNVFLTSGSSAYPKTAFDHNMNDVVNLFFAAKNEKNHYVAETKWIDPTGEEYRTIRTTHDVQQESKKSMDQRHISKGTTRVHTVTTKELYDRKPGLWKVVLYLDGELARRLEFTVR
jgi:hypothetical protein